MEGVVKKRMKKVIVLLSSFNGSKYIERQIESILCQSYKNCDLLIRDDGSTDQTVHIIYKYLDKLRWYSGENLKPACSFMKMLFECGDYDYYAFADQDDIWDQDKIEVAVNELEKYNKAALYYCNSRLVNSNGESYNCLNYKNASMECTDKCSPLNAFCCGKIMGCTMVLNRNLVEIIRKCGYPTKMIMHDSFIEAVCAAIGGKIVFDGNPHMDYRQHSENVVGRKPGWINAIKYRWRFLVDGSAHSIADQCTDIIKMYKEFIDEENLFFLEMVAGYRSNLKNRIRLACSRKFFFESLKDSIFIRMSIMLGKR